MRVHLLYFGILKDLLGREREDLELDAGAQVADALRLLRARTSNENEGVWTSLAVAVNREYASLSTPLKQADEVALLPPVSGGSSRTSHNGWWFA